MGAVPVLIGILLGTLVALIGHTDATIIPRLPFIWSIVVGVTGALLGTSLWQLLSVNMSNLVAYLSGAVIALDLYIVVAKYAQRP